MVDEAMLEMSELVAEMTDIDGYIEDIEMGTSMSLEYVEMDMPVQLDIDVLEDGSLSLGGAPPLYYVATTILPVFHQLKVKISVTEKSEEYASGEQGMES